MEKAEVEGLIEGHTLSERTRDFSNHTFDRPKIQQSFPGINPFSPESRRNLDIKSKLQCSFSTTGLEKDSHPTIPIT